MVQSFNDDFSVVWHDPKDAELTWAYDPMHQPSPLPPLAQEIVRHTIKLSMDSSVVFVNGYTFMTFGGLPTPAPEIMQRGAAAVWQEDYLPRVRQAYLGILDGDYDSVSASALGERLPVLLSESGRAFRLTMVVVIGFMSPTFELLAFCERNLGEDGAMLAAILLQGYENDSSSAGAGLGELALEALKQPAVAEALRAGRFDNLDQLPGGGEFLTRLHAYLNEYGWRPESWGVLHQPTWAEDPRVPLMLVGRYLADAASSLIGSLEAAAERREEAQAGLADLLQSEDLQELGDLLAVARLHVSISESRAMWQLLILGCLRVPILALGNKLQEAGSLNEANDIFFLSLDEVQQAAAAPSGAWLGLVSQRKLDFEHWQTLRPPGFIGAQPVHESGGSEIAAMMRHFGGGTPAPSLEPLTKGSAREISWSARQQHHPGLRFCLEGVPRLHDKYYDELDTSEWGLFPVAQLETFHGLIFATFDAEAPPLTEYLGDFAWYLDSWLDRTEGGVEVISGIRRWVLDCNWKVAAENFVGDGYHGQPTHQSAFKVSISGGTRPETTSGIPARTRFGHGLGGSTPNDPTQSAAAFSRLPGIDPVVDAYTQRVLPETRERLGDKADIYFPVHGTVFPNLSIQPNFASMHVWHPRGPGRIEVRDYTIVEKDAPDEVKARLNFECMYRQGPAGTWEQDDSDNWQQVTAAARGTVARRIPMNYQMGLGHDAQHDVLPGDLS